MKLQTLILATIVSFNIDFSQRPAEANPLNCRPFRNSYEKVIKNGAMKRPSPVADETAAMTLATKAAANLDLREASIRMMQAYVIREDRQGAEAAKKLLDRTYLLVIHDTTLEKMLPKRNQFCKTA